MAHSVSICLHCVNGDYESDKNESDKSEHDLETGRRTLTCGCSFVADGVDVAVIAPHIHRAVDDGRRREHGASGREAPHFHPSGSVKGIDVIVIAPHVDPPVNDSWGGVHLAPGRIVPHVHPSGSVKGVDLVVLAPDVHDAVNDCRG